MKASLICTLLQSPKEKVLKKALNMVITLETSQSSGWLKTLAPEKVYCGAEAPTASARVASGDAARAAAATTPQPQSDAPSRPKPHEHSGRAGAAYLQARHARRVPTLEPLVEGAGAIEGDLWCRGADALARVARGDVARAAAATTLPP